ncbi:MAG: hypothetical protein RIB67_01665 [Miltoncostaeaceae bacterium]
MADPAEMMDPRVQVVVLTPNEPTAAGHAELQALGGGEDESPMAELAARPWLTQADGPVRGAELETLGLAVYAGHRELALVNVPTTFIESGVRLLKELGTYVLAGGTLDGGDVLQIRHDLPCIVGIHTPDDPEEPGPARVVLLA